MSIKKALSLLTKILKWSVKPLIFMVSLSISLVLYILIDPPQPILDFTAHQIENSIEKSTGFKAEIGRIKKLLIRPGVQTVLIDNFRLLKDKNAKGPFLTIPKIEINLEALSYLTGQANQSFIVIHSPAFNIIQYANGTFNFMPKDKKKKKKQEPFSPPSPFRLPKIQLRVEAAVVNYIDENPSHALETTAQIPLLVGEIMDQEHLMFRTRLESELSNLEASGSMNIWKGQGELEGTLQNKNIHKIAKYATRVKGVSVDKGQLDINLQASWDDYKMTNLKYTGNLNLADLVANVPYYRKDVNLDLDLKITEKQVLVHELLFESGRNTLLLAGVLDNYRDKTRSLNFDINLKRLQLDEILAGLELPEKSMLAIRKLKPQGWLSARLDVDGELLKPTVKGTLQIPQAQVMNININEGKTQFSYQKSTDHLKVISLAVGVFGGRLTAQGDLSLGKSKTMNVSANAHSISLGRLGQELKLKIPRDYVPAGQFNLQANARGPLDSIQAKGQLASARIAFPQSPKLTWIQNLKTAFQYNRNQVKVALNAHSNDFGPLTADMTLSHQDAIQGHLMLKRLPVTAANRWSSKQYVSSGMVAADATIRGSIKALKHNWTQFSGTLNLNTDDLTARIPVTNPQTGHQNWIQQNLAVLKVAVDWNQGVANIKTLKLQEEGSQLTGGGQVYVNRLLSKQSRQNAVNVKLNGVVDFRDFPILTHYDVNRGNVVLDAHVNTLAQGDLKVVVNSTGKNIKAKGVRVDGFKLATEYNNRQVTIHEANIQQDDDKLTLKGSVDLKGETPTLDLNIQTDNFDIPTAVTLLPDKVQARLRGEAPEEMPSPDPVNIRYNLPRTEDRTLFRASRQQVDTMEHIQEEELVIPLGEIMDKHWQYWKAEPRVYPKLATDEDRKQLKQKKEIQPTLIATMKGKVSLNADIQGTANRPDITLQTLVTDAEIKGKPLNEVYIKSHMIDSRLQLQDIHIQEPNGGRIQAHGEINLNENMYIELEGKGIDLNSLNSFMSPNNRLAGYVDMVTVIEGQPSEPKALTNINVNRALFNQIFFDRIDALSDYEEGYLRNMRVGLSFGNNQMVIQGDVPLRDKNDPMEIILNIRDESFNMINLFTDKLDWQKGDGAVLVKLVGSPKHPELEGNVSIRNARIYLPALKESISDMDIESQLYTKKLTLETMRAKYGGGSIDVTGDMDLLDLRPSFFNLKAIAQNVHVNRNVSGKMDVNTVIADSEIKIKGFVSKPAISGKVIMGKNGEINFPFLKESDPSADNIQKISEQDNQSQNYILAGLKVLMPHELWLRSPLFDIPITSEKGLRLKHRGGDLNIEGLINAKRGSMYLVDNILNIEKLQVEFEPPQLSSALSDRDAINPTMNIVANFKVEGADKPVKAKITGTLQDLRNRELKFDFIDTQKLSETEIMAQLSGANTLKELGSGDIGSVASKLSSSLLRGLFNPLTSQLSELLGLEDLSFGLAGQTPTGPIFSFSTRLNPFFFIKDILEASKLSFLNKVSIRSEALVSDKLDFEVGASYPITRNWNISADAVPTDPVVFNNQQYPNLRILISGNYQLQALLDFLRELNGEEKQPEEKESTE